VSGGGVASWDVQFMMLALENARLAAGRGEVPVGAVVVADGQLIGWGCNDRKSTGAVLGHAELNALRMAAEALGDWRLPKKSTVYVTLEPCIMCAGALLQARVGRIVFGCRDPKFGALRSLYCLAEDPRQSHRAGVEEGVLKELCESGLQLFFENIRSGSPS